MRLIRTREWAVRVMTGLLAMQALAMVLAGPVQLVAGDAPPEAVLAALLAPLGKSVTLVALVVICRSAGRSSPAIRLWVLAQLLGIAAQLFAPQADGTVMDQLLSLVLFTGIVVALRPRRRELLELHLPQRVAPLRAVGATPAAVGGVMLAAQARVAGPLGGVGVDDLAEVRFDLVVTGLALAATSVWALTARVRSVALLPGAACLVAALLCLLRPHDWSQPGLPTALALGLGALAQLVPFGRRDVHVGWSAT